MTTLNTIIEEEKEEAHKYWNQEAQNTEQKWLTPDTWGIIYEIITTAMQRAYEAGVQKARADWLRSEIEKLEVEMKEYVWDNGECSICGYDSIYNEGEEHRCEVFNDSLTSIITRYKEELLSLEKEV